ncbi:MAG: aldehyde dehydrogenase family protein [Rhizobiaceae bacterium]|nr:aldehyde dehydrogenase family protein [Rhizobiaceae bacterium]
MRTYGIIINGKLEQTAKTKPVKNPATNEIVGHMPLAATEDLDRAVTAAEAAYQKWRLVPDSARAAACTAIADVIEQNLEEIAQIVTKEQGKPLNGIGSRFEIGGAVAWSRNVAGLELPVEIIDDNPDAPVTLHRKPVGVVGSITPWNWPISIAIWHILPAIRAGNAVVIKPSPNTPLSTLRLVELINEVLMPGLLNAVTGENSLGAAMTNHPGIAKITFTGSTATGIKVMSSAADSLKRLTLELGGNDAGIVLPDADPKAIVEKLFWGAFINNGQTCAALKRLYVHDSIYDEVCRELTAFAQKVITGNGQNEDSDLGPLQNEMQYGIVSRYVDEAIAKGGRVLTGGAPTHGDGYFYPVTLVADIDHGCDLVDKEQFGPALPIIRYSDLDDVVAKANATTYGLGGSVWSSDLVKAREIAGRLECGTVWINAHGLLRPDTPFSGVKQSGIGVQFGVEGLRELTTIQSVVG